MVRVMEEEQAQGRVFNIGGTEEVSISELAQRVIDLVGSESKIRFVPYDEAYEEGFEDMARRVPDITRISNLIGFAPSRTLDDIILDVAAAI
jgi:UDP-glucose 4-epimerase